MPPPPRPRGRRRARAAPPPPPSMPGRASAATCSAVEPRALADRAAGKAHRMGEDRALRLADRHRTEFHAAAAFASAPRLRSAAITSARIATAISAGDCAPIGRPIGAWIAARLASSKPASAQPLEAFGVGLPAAEGADVEAVGSEARRASAPSSILGSWVSATSAVNGSSADLRQRVVRPLGDERHVGKALGRREGGARVDDGEIEVRRSSPSAPAPG